MIATSKSLPQENGLMQHKELEINGQRVAYYESDGKGSPVLFIHGNSLSSLSFARQLASPLGKNHRLVALDLPGHGRSAPAQDPRVTYTVPGYAKIVAGFAKALALDRAVLVGWSLGGHVLLEASEQLQNSPGLMLFGTPPVGKPMAAEAFLPCPTMGLMFTSELSTLEAEAATAEFFKPGSEIPPFFPEDILRTDGRAREALGISIGEGRYADEVKIVTNLKKPLAMVHGIKDPLVNLSYLKGINMPTLWRGEIQIIPDAGHTPQWEQPEQFNRLLMEFVGDCGQ
ncbi:MAG: alpha/beta hydrolase [Desulfurivibrionaceae bacterium]|jgi:pimeloyl-ACP methyl ester carboxylesterase